MKKYKTVLCDPDGYVTIWTEEQILEDFYDYWMSQMVKKYGSKEYVLEHYTEKDCIMDWVVLNWANEIT